MGRIVNNNCSGFFVCKKCRIKFTPDNAAEKEINTYIFPACPSCFSSNLDWTEGSLEGDEN